MVVWMTELRKATPKKPRYWHDLRPDGRFTVCGRPAYSYGHKLAKEAAEQTYRATRCRTCAGENPRYGPDDPVKGRVA